MIYAALIENEIENEILLCGKIESREKTIWSFPHLISDDDIEYSTAMLINICRDECSVNIEIEASSKHYENFNLVYVGKGGVKV